MYNTNQMYGMNQYPNVGYNFQQPISGVGYNNFQQSIPNKTLTLQGKMIDNIEVVKGTDISLDGSVNYFPLADGSAIVTKQLQPNGTSKIIVYKPIEEEPAKEVKYITETDFSNSITDVNNKINNIENKLENLLKKKEK